MEGQHRAEIGVGEDVAVEHEHAPLRDVHRVAHAARGAERLFLHRVGQAARPRRRRRPWWPAPRPPGRSRTARVPDPMAREQRKLVGEEGKVEQRDDRLGPIVGERPEPGALAAREDDGGYLVGAQGSASAMSITGMPSRMGYALRHAGQMIRVSSNRRSPLQAGQARMARAPRRSSSGLLLEEIRTFGPARRPARRRAASRARRAARAGSRQLAALLARPGRPVAGLRPAKPAARASRAKRSLTEVSTPVPILNAP